jgi:hypothetical protein
MKYILHFTLDYEIHGNGDGNPWNLMVEPTGRLMDLLEKYSQKLTIMADAAEILAFKRYYSETGKDDFHVTEIESQLQDAIRRGHDVQLHVHSSWFNARWDGKGWDQCIEEYNMAVLPVERIDAMVGQCVSYLQDLLTPVKPDYKVWLFRAANWSMMPTENIYQVLLKHGITADTSVYKGGVQGGNVCYDYREAYHNLLNYPADARNINHRAPKDQSGIITEYPIYTEMRPFWSFVSPIRIFRMVRAKFHKHKHIAPSDDPGKAEIDKADNRNLNLKAFFRKSPWKLDFNQATGSQLIAASKRIKGLVIEDRETVDVILIGHSKSFLPYNERTLEKYLKWAAKNL